MDEKLRILKMVEEGTMTAEQAVDLMSAMELDVSVQSVAKSLIFHPYYHSPFLF